MPDALLDLEGRRAGSNRKSPSWATCAPAPFPQQVAVVEIPTVTAIGKVTPATVPTIG